jgi:purine-binding chemotaxis protein CheW
MASEAKPSPDRKKEETASSQRKALLAASQAEQPEARLVEPEQRLDAVPAEPVGPGGNAPARFVSFRLDQRLYALPLDHVERALRMVAITPVPEAPPWVAGVIDLQGRVIPVVDLRQRFGQESGGIGADDRLLIVEMKERTMAAMVNEVEEVLEVPAHQLKPSSELMPDSRPLAAVIRRDEDLILVLDTVQLFPTEGGTIGQ